MAFQRSDQQRGSRYSQGGKVNLKGGKITWWERTVYPKSPTDITYVVTARYAQRPDLLAFDVYGKSTLQWFIMQYNAISDLYDDFSEGAVIQLPTRARLFGELLTKS